MENIDVDNISEVNYLGQTAVEVKFKDGTTRVYSGAEMEEMLPVLNHWTPPMA